MEYIRLISIILFIPINIVVGLLVSSSLESLLGIWAYYFAAIIIPILGLLSTWFIAPYHKTFFTIYMYAFGMVVARFAVFPAYYPENHAMAYLPTYIPFSITAIWAGLIVMVIYIYEHRKNAGI